MLLCKRQYEKEYNDYKKSIDDIYTNIVEKISAEMLEIRKELEEKD
jgi:hypothetical protein